MYILKKKEFWIGIVVMAVLVVGSVAVIGNRNQVDAADPGNCKNSDISGGISGSSATVKNNSDHTCTVGLAVFKLNGSSLDDQELYGNDEKDFASGKTTSLGVGLPDCDYQIDLYAGNFPGSAHFSSEHLIDSQTVTGRCPAATPAPTPVPTPINHLPLAFLDQVDCTDVRGWARDLDNDPTPATSNASIKVHIYNGSTFLAEVLANVPREPQVGNHAFIWPIPASLKDGRVLTISAYAIDNQNNSGHTLAVGSPRTLNTAQCIPATPVPTPTQTPVQTPVPGLSCSPAQQSANINSDVTLTATGGTGSYVWTATSDATPASGTSASLTTRFSSSGSKTVTVSSGARVATCNVSVNPVQVPTLTCSVNRTTANINDVISFSATGGTNAPASYRWNLADGFPQAVNSVSLVNAIFGTSGVKNVIVTDGSQTATCPVTIQPSQISGVSCFPLNQTISSGGTVTLRASGGTGIYTWSAPNGDPSNGFYQDFSTRYYSALSTTYQVTVRSGGDNATCSVQVQTGATPTPIPGTMTIQKMGRNITQGQAIESASMVVRSNDTVEFLIHVRALSSSMTNVIVTDALPQGINYIPNTTSVNNNIVQDGVTGGGINIGSLAFGQEAIVRFSALIAPGTTFPNGNLTVINTAYVRADNLPTMTAQMSVSRTSIGTVAGVQTGPGESLLLALLLSAAMTYGYMAYTGTPLFNRRDAMAKVRHYGASVERLNFMRFLR
jgi:uncharacterized repeat protein (TIGR01451 family)